MAEGTHQIVQGNLDRAAAAMAVADKQSLPDRDRIQSTPRGGTSYTQRLVTLCPEAAQGWPEDRRSQSRAGGERLDRGRCSVTRHAIVSPPRVHRAGDGAPSGRRSACCRQRWDDLALSPLSAVMLANSVSAVRVSDLSETGFRRALVAAFTAIVDDPGSVIGLEIQQEADTR